MKKLLIALGFTLVSTAYSVPITPANDNSTLLVECVGGRFAPVKCPPGYEIAPLVDAYQVGIPAPMWGAVNPLTATAPAAPAEWPSAEAAGYYYIDNTVGGATDSGNTYGYPDLPRSTIPEIAYAAGSYIEIHGGPYTAGGQLIFTANGTEANPVWFRGTGIDAKPVISAETIAKGSYLFMENLYYDTQQETINFRPHNSSNLHHAIVRNSEFVGTGVNIYPANSSAIAVYGGDGNRFHNIIIYNNTIRDFGDWQAASENDYHGILVQTNVDNAWVLDNTGYHLGGDTVQIGKAGGITNDQRVSHIYVANNLGYENLENAVDIKAANNVVISSNEMWGYYPISGNSSTGSAFVIHDSPDNVWAINNKVYNSGMGINTTSGTDIWLVGNIIYDIKHGVWDTGWDPNNIYSAGAAIHFRGSATGGVYNNAIYDYDIGFQMGSGVIDASNNILYERAETTGHDIFHETVGASTFSDNIIYHTTYAVSIDATCTDCIYTSPLFSGDPIVNNFILTGSSPAINVGKSTTSTKLTDFRNFFGVEITEDINANARPVGVFDIGATEYQP